MKGRKTAAIPGIKMAAVAIEDDTLFGIEVRKYLDRCGKIRGKYKVIATRIKTLDKEILDDYEFGNAVRALLVEKSLIVERDGKYEAGKS